MATYNYPVSSLSISKQTDENGAVSETATDKIGRTIYQATEISTGVFAYTYYVYDAFGRVRYAIQPEGWQQVLANSSQLSQSIADNFAFQYKYDERGRMTAKRVPGADWVYMVYDKLDRVVAT
ncbi:MAG: RHS repeat-associated core domain-containing protein, partial [Bacteroidetes bacterium]